MSQEPDEMEARERNPRFPNETMVDAIGRIGKIFAGLGRTSVPAEAVAKAMGFAGLSGASRTTLAALSYYGLIGREGGKYKISDLAVRIIHPIDQAEKGRAVWEACFSPKLFSEIKEEGLNCSEDVLATILIHKGFTEEGAKRAAWVFKDNLAFAATLGQPEKEAEARQKPTIESQRPSLSASSTLSSELPVP